MNWIRGLLFDNWRNKGVALFFAFTIWVVAFQSEEMTHFATLKVAFTPQDAERFTITEALWTAREGSKGDAPFDGEVGLNFSGSRKQIEKLKEDLERGSFAVRSLVVPTEPKVFYQFQSSDFGIDRHGVTITTISPESVYLIQEERGTRVVGDLAQFLVLTGKREGYDVETRSVEPAEVRLSGPASVLERVTVSLSFDMTGRIEANGVVKLALSALDPADQEIVAKHVSAEPSEVEVTASQTQQTLEFEPDRVRILFTIPPTGFGVSIVPEEFVGGDSIPVKFSGPRDEIERLRDSHKTDPSFALSVRVPQLRREEESTFVFTEASLQLDGYPGVQIGAHKSRVDENKGLWTYRVVPVVDREG